MADCQISVISLTIACWGHETPIDFFSRTRSYSFMFTISKAFSFCYGHRLRGDQSKCRHLHGHSAKAVLYLQSATLDERGMVMHFHELKQNFGKWIDEEIDHVMLLDEKDPLITELKKQNERFKALPFAPTAENIARLFFEMAKEFSLPVSKVEIWESETSCASYSA